MEKQECGRGQSVPNWWDPQVLCSEYQTMDKQVWLDINKWHKSVQLLAVLGRSQERSVKDPKPQQDHFILTFLTSASTTVSSFVLIQLAEPQSDTVSKHLSFAWFGLNFKFSLKTTCPSLTHHVCSKILLHPAWVFDHVTWKQLCQKETW